MKRIAIVYLSVIGLLLLVIFAMAYKFLIAGSTAPADDRRIALRLDSSERALVLAEMRGFLTATQQIAAAVVRNDTAAIASAARPMGMAAAGNVPATLAAKLPLEFKQLGHAVHGDFDRIALDAEALGDARHSLAQLSETLNKCVACHAVYQIAMPPAAGRDVSRY